MLDAPERPQDNVTGFLRPTKPQGEECMRHRSLAAALALGSALMIAAPAFGEELEVLHYWTSGGESKAVNVLKAEIEKKGHSWKDSAIAGGGGQNAMTVLKARAVSGNPPAVVQMRGPAVQDWAEQ